MRLAEYNNNRPERRRRVERRPKRRKPRILLWLLIIVMMLGTCGYVGIRAVNIISSRNVQFSLKDIGELATQAGYYTNVQVISGSREIFGLAIPLTEKKYIFSYDGVIKAGYDFSEIRLDMDEIAMKVTVTLPEARILSNEVDQNSFTLLDESKNIFNTLKMEDVNESLTAMKKESEEKAVANGILENARTNAELLIRGFLASTIDMSKYTVEFK